ncbi:MAG: hypothetical protein ACRCXX_07965 [Cetobacterium sp.]|uniref:hypothetical protein n=1 Tax=Cetobacterium sp. TaxID=2071632 RepID=UPI003F3D4ED9
MIVKLTTSIKKFFNRESYLYTVDAKSGKSYVQLRITTTKFLGRFKVTITMRSDYYNLDCKNATCDDMGKVCEAMKPFVKESKFREFLDEKINPNWGNWYY